ncbi:ABC transporter permease subunit [Gracilibacillus suaedae]|uniref:ABC transporter permease subunit n=1 Tax=Gracilibacillus suaedae TaxID=2820273 RepID=UPI001ABEC226
MVVFLALFPLSFFQAFGSIREVPKEFLEVAKAYKMTKWDTIRLTYLPAMKAYWMAVL